MSHRPSHHLLTRTVAPASLVVSVAEVKSALRVEHNEDDALIEQLIAAAAEYAGAPNGVTGMALITQTWALSVRGFDRDGRLELPITPVQSVESIQYYDRDNVLQTLDVADFYLYSTEDWAYIEQRTGFLPGLFDRRDALTVTFVAGFGESEAIPENIRLGIKLTAAHWYENRIAVTDRQMMVLPMGAEMLLNLSRKGWVS